MTSGHSEKRGSFLSQKANWISSIDDLKKFEASIDEVLKQGIDPVIDDGVLANISPFQKAGLLAADVLDKNQLKKGEELLADYISQRKENK